MTPPTPTPAHRAEAELKASIRKLLDQAMRGERTTELFYALAEQADRDIAAALGVNGDGFSALRAANIARNKHWDPAGVLGLVFRSNELAGETGELANVVKKIERERLGIRGSRATAEQLAEEAADVLISLDLLAMAENIDLWAAVVAKFNATSEKYGLPITLPLASQSSGKGEGEST